MSWTKAPRSAVDFRVRSWLCAPTLRARLVARAMSSGADIAHFDLEDSVQPDKKERARESLMRHFEQGCNIPTAVRLNNLRCSDGLRDLLFLIDHSIVPDIIILAKASIPADIEQVRSIAHSEVPDLKIFAVIETAEGLEQLRGLHSCPNALHGLIFGAADFATDIGIDPRTADLSWVRQELVLAARRFRTLLIDSPCFRLRDEDALLEELQTASALGFDGKIALHPSQVEAINTAFTPSAMALQRAREFRDQFEGGDQSVLLVDQEIVGPPHLKYNKLLLARAKSNE